MPEHCAVRFRERMSLTFRLNFTNIFNRTEMANPTFANASAATTKSGSGLLTGGFGFVNYVGGGTLLPSRQGTAEMRFAF